MVNWKVIGLTIAIIGILMAIVGGVLWFMWRNDSTKSKWWVWLLIILGILMAVGGGIASLTAGRAIVKTTTDYVIDKTAGRLGYGRATDGYADLLPTRREVPVEAVTRTTRRSNNMI